MRGFRRSAGRLSRSVVLLIIVAAFLCGACSINSATRAGAPIRSIQSPSPTPSPSPSPVPSSSPSPSPSPSAVPAGQTEPVPILMYHYIRPVPTGSNSIGRDLSVTPEGFAEQLKYLADHQFTTMTMQELADVRAKRLALPSNPIVLTFDDGYRDFYTNAWPLLRDHGFKATSFIITNAVDQPHYLTWEMIDEMQRSGLIEFGAHTLSHRDLPSLSDTSAKQEIEQSKQTLETHLGHPVRSFCYPAGRFTDRDVALVHSAGFEVAVTTKAGDAKPDQDALRLPRVRIHGTTTLSQFGAMLQ